MQNEMIKLLYELDTIVKMLIDEQLKINNQLDHVSDLFHVHTRENVDVIKTDKR